MSDSGDEQPEEMAVLSEQVKASWHRFLDTIEAIRPELYRYCRFLTRTPWDAEDLVQDTLMRSFVTLGTLFGDAPPPRVRAWLFRVASNLWIDHARRTQVARATEAPAPGEVYPTAAQELREGAGTLLVRLAPQERAAVVLKDVFDFSIEETAAVLSTTAGAVKAALHRGRGKLSAPEEEAGTVPRPGALDEFCAAFNARDLDRLTGLLLDDSTVEIVGVVTEYGRDAPKDPRTGSFAGTLSPITIDERGGVAPEFLDGYLGKAPRCEVRAYRDGWILVFWYGHAGGPAVRTVMSLASEGDRIRQVRNYFFNPDVIAEVCAELELPCKVNGYRFWRRTTAASSSDPATDPATAPASNPAR